MQLPKRRRDTMPTLSQEEEKAQPEPSRPSRKKKDQELHIASPVLSQDESLSNRVSKKKEYDFTEEDEDQESLEQMSYQSTKKKRDSSEPVRDIEDELPVNEIATKHSGGKKKKDVAKSSDEISDEGSARGKTKKKETFAFEEEEVVVRSSGRKKKEEVTAPPSVVDTDNAIPAGVNEFDEEEDVPLVTKPTRGEFTSVVFQLYCVF